MTRTRKRPTATGFPATAFRLTGFFPPAGFHLTRALPLTRFLALAIFLPMLVLPFPPLGLAQEPTAPPAADASKRPDRLVPTVVVVVGADGAPEYGRQFAAWADRWQAAAREAGSRYIEIGRESPQPDTPSDRQQLEETLRREAEVSDNPLWLVLIGHGTFYRDVARFNLRGPDFSAEQLHAWLAPFQRPLVVINCASSSGPFLKTLAAPGRTILTATRSGSEQNFSRFGDYFSAALTDAEADLDHDQQVSLLEAFLAASAGVAGFYEAEARLATEHALLDDNGDGQGTPAEFFRGARAVRAARDGAPLDGSLARRQHLLAGPHEPLTPEQQARREELEEQLEQLRQRKTELSEDAYYEQLEAILLPLAEIYQAAEKRS